MRAPRSLSAAGVGLLLGGCLLALTSPRAGAQALPPLPTTDYAGFPANNGLPAGCDAFGVSGVSYSVNGGASVVNFQDIDPISAGDTVVMSWTDVAPACDGGPIVLSMKSAPGETFDPTVDQELDYPYAVDTMAAGEGGSLSYVLPDLLDDSFAGCFGQLDAIVGLPLQTVGPGGSFYGSALRGDGGPHLLIGAWNGGYAQCVPLVTTTTTEPTTTTTEATTTTTEPSSLTTAEPTTTTTVPLEEFNPTTALGVKAAAAQLPTTGVRGNLAVFGASLVLIGAMVCLVMRDRARRDG
jgi:hypothetical protein